ncbi:hypothetical protein HDU96_010959 [Phlyctochytrium bullatum]|nr:hypothetical protein HDU96_010959 [Phlyctochytrium bullatum]
MSAVVKLHPALNPGAVFPKIELPGIVNGTDGIVALHATIAGRYKLVVVFRGAFCPYCRDHLSYIESQRQLLADNGVDVVAVSADGREEAVELIKRLGIAFPVAYDLAEPQMKQIGIYISSPKHYLPDRTRNFAEPAAFLLTPDNTIKYVEIGSAPMMARTNVERLLDGHLYSVEMIAENPHWKEARWGTISYDLRREDDHKTVSTHRHTALNPGSAFPALELAAINTPTGTVSLSPLRASNRYLFVVVYRGSFCPFCRDHLTYLESKQPYLAENNIDLVAISADTPSEALDFATSAGLTFPIGHGLTDAQMKQLGVYISSPAHYLPDRTRNFAEPAAFLVAPDGTIKYAEIGSAPMLARTDVDAMVAGHGYSLRRAREDARWEEARWGTVEYEAEEAPALGKRVSAESVVSGNTFVGEEVVRKEGGEMDGKLGDLTTEADAILL